MKSKHLFAICLYSFVLLQCTQPVDKATSESTDADTTTVQPIDTTETVQEKLTPDTLPAPTESATKNSKVVGWPDNVTPSVPEGFEISTYADNLKNPRWIYVLPNGDVLVSEASSPAGSLGKAIKGIASGKWKSQGSYGSANRITLFRDANDDGMAEVRETFLQDLNNPFGMVLLGNQFYVANTDGIITYPYTEGATKLEGKGKKITDLPAGGYNNHWTRNIISNKDGSKLFVSVGSGSNVAEHGLDNEKERANILEINPDGSGKRIFASGLRNPVGMDLEPTTNTLWTAVNERDKLGDELVPDYLTSVKENGFYGWPWAYYGPHEDERVKEKRPDMVQKTIVPDVALGSHTASLGLVFYDKKAYPAHYHGAAFIAQHGSWNSSKLVGYKVVYVLFKNGRPTSAPKDFVTGFIKDEAKGEVYGRPVGLALLPDGSLLIADDAANTIWKVKAINK